MKIDNITLPTNAVLAPIAGYSDVGFREICAQAGAGLTYTEMVSAKGLCFASDKTKELLHTTESEKIKAVQIFGCEPYYIEKAVQEDCLQKFDIIDINMGCPMTKIVKNGEGSALLNNPQLASQVVKSALTCKKPITVKMRIGYYNDKIVASDFAKLMQDSGASALTIHGRTKEQMYSGKANWDIIAQVVKAVSIPVFANGDVNTLEDYYNILSTTGADGVMLARGALGNPLIFSQIAGKSTDGINLGSLIIQHINTMKMFHADNYITSNMKKHLAYYCKGMQDSKHFKLQAFSCQNTSQMIEIIKNYFEV